MRLVALQIEAGWDVEWNRLYEAQDAPGSHSEEAEREKEGIEEGGTCVLLMSRRYSDPDRTQYILNTDRMGREAGEERYRLRVGINGMDHLLLDCELQGLEALKEKLNATLTILSSQSVSDPERAQAALSEEPNPAWMRYPKMPFVVLSNWQVICNSLCDVDFGSPSAKNWMFGTDLVFLTTQRANAEGDRYILSLDWLPNYDEAGSYRLQVVVNDYNDEVLHTVSSRSRTEMTALLARYQDIINRFCTRADMKMNLERVTGRDE
ncbi:hypothetical protein [Gorillibacterium sp. sgz5001074]|uniref:hypothetical protein n=1 Tax=Gorillibacterium sp. sgz5001074 TaxID=3446695 RepID=UPI003F67586C